MSGPSIQPPIPDSSSGSSFIEDLSDKLDSLWAKHLILLDQYDKAQKQLQKHMSSVRRCVFLAVSCSHTQIFSRAFSP